jgi:hypothetical protein
MCLFNTLLLHSRDGRARVTPPRTAPFLVTALLVAAATALPAGAVQTVQPGTPTPSDAPVRKPIHHHHIKAAMAQPPAQESPATPAPAAPEPPHWPANETPAKPEISWDSHGLRIAASNASLHQILDDVSTATGAKVEGMGADERVFGDYGPGDARDVLSQLLHGSGYNVLMIGDQGEGTPREIVLSARHAAGNPNQGAANRPNSDMQDEDAPEQPEPEDQGPPPQLMHPPMMPQQGPPGAPGTPRTPQQLLQELQQRQQEMQNQQQMPQQPIPSPPQE